MNVSEVKRLKQHEAENAKLKELVAELSLDNKSITFLMLNKGEKQEGLLWR